MPTHRREQTIRLAEALGVQRLDGEGTADLMDRMIEHVEGGKTPREQEEDEERAAACEPERPRLQASPPAARGGGSRRRRRRNEGQEGLGL
jgi:hypothetical protein